MTLAAIVAIAWIATALVVAPLLGQLLKRNGERYQLPQSTVQPDVPAAVSRTGHPEPGAADNTPN